MAKERLVLASQSPRRRELLKEAGLVFEVIEPDAGAECGICSRETPPEMAARLGFQKAANVAGKIDHGYVIGCDTIAECMGNILGKPTDRTHARWMLQLLRGRVHAVYSGLCIWHRPSGRHSVRVAVSKLKMDPIEDETLEKYLDTEAWVGKSGAFGFQDGPPWLQLLEGSASNVVGLPMELLQSTLAEWDLSLEMFRDSSSSRG